MLTAPHILSRTSRHKAQEQGAGQPFLGDLRLAKARVHEFCGGARRTLALKLAQDMSGSVLWIQPQRSTEWLNADGARAFIELSRLIFVTAQRTDDMLWVMEEALRSGATPLVIADLSAPPALTPVRRLHLAAEAGAGIQSPLGLLLTPGDGGAQGIESRWALDHDHKGNNSEKLGWTLHRRRHRAKAYKSWPLRQSQSGLELSS